MDIKVIQSPPRRRAGTAHADEVEPIIHGLRRIVKELHRYSQEVRACFGLTGPQLWVVKVLARSGPTSVGDLARALAVHQSSLSVLLDRLESRGLVRRVRQAPDRRVVRIVLTVTGRAMARRAPEPAQGRLLHALRAMPTPRVRQIRRAIDCLVAAMEADGVEAHFFFADE